ncbi:MAG: FtsQ-type POTRA domain-containing protein, partial [Alphaproteobacteria bacterium]|nr:FtsQ-type POTRA domain-containing protein [Alphaproteobacteria bacterium]
MRKRKTPLRGSVTQNVSARVGEQDGVGFLVRLGLLGVLVFVFLIVAVLGWRSGWVAKKAEELQTGLFDLTRDLGFEVRDISLKGRREASKVEIYSALNVKRGLPILGIDLKEAATSLDKIPWIDHVRVERRLPDTISVILSERKPMARWQKDNRFYVIDDEGKVLHTAKAEKFPSLPQVVGTGADKEAKAFLSILNEYPEIMEKLDSAVRVGERRWDIYIHK